MATQVVGVAPGLASPWRTIWLSPRRAMRDILAAEVRPGFTLVVALAALHFAFATLAALAIKGELSVNMAAMPVALGVLRVVFGVLVGPFLLAITGGWFGGQANPDEIRQSVAWSGAPFAATAVCWIPLIVAGQPSSVDAPTALDVLHALFALALSALYAIVVVWAIVLQVVTLAEVQHFSKSRAFGSLAVLMIPAVLLWLI